MDLLSDKILLVFFAAMRSGYAGNAAKSTVAELPGSKLIRYAQGEFEVIDCYFVTPRSDYSFGTTTVYHRGDAVWMMQYQGHYPESVIPFLKTALRQTYKHGYFMGGRGPQAYGEDDLCYINSVRKSDWKNFCGREEVIRRSRAIGYHEYNGLLLL